MTRPFARFACIDWSGARGERLPGIAVAECAPGDAAPVLLPGPHARGRWSRASILDWLLAQRDDLLVGIDFSPSLPFADAGAFFPGWTRSPPDARALWALVDTLSADDPHLAATGFVDHPEASRHYRRHGGREGDRFGGGTGRFRVTETASRTERLGNAQSCFNLVGAAQVGKSSLTGMRLLHRLGGQVPVWPFDPVPASGPLIVEIYTTIAARAAGVTGGSKIRDAARLDAALDRLGSSPHAPLGRYDDHRTDAILTAAWLRRVADDRALWRAPPPAIARTEGWTFGVPCRMAEAVPA